MKKPSGSKIFKTLMLILGILSLGIGIVGIVVPVLPTTPFLLLSSFLFIKSSKKMNDWLINHKIFGEYIYNYKHHRAIRKKDKIITLIILYIGISISFMMIDKIAIRVLLLAVAAGVSIHVLTIKTLTIQKAQAKAEDNPEPKL